MPAALDFLDPNVLAQLVELTIGYGVGGAASRLVDPLVQGGANAAWTETPTMPVDVVTLARLHLLGLINPADAADEALNTGFDSTRFERYIQALKTPPSPAELLELLRRQNMTPDAVRAALLQTGLDARYVDFYLGLERNLMSVADLAMARQQEFIGDGELHARAAEVGYLADDADLYFKMAGLPPGLTVGLELLRRGDIDEARFAQYVAEGHTKTKYTPDLLELQYMPLSAATAAELLIRERISEAEAVAIGEKNGIRRADFLAWSNGLGRPPGIMEALTLVNRGVKGDPHGAEAHAYFREVVARSDVRTEYADDLYNLRVHYPPLFQVERALNAGTITKQIAHDTLTKEGYPPEWVDAIVNAHAAGAKGKHRDLAAAIIDALYEAGLESRPEALTALEALGYDQADADMYLNLWLARRIVSELVRGVSLIRTRYVAWKIDRPTALDLLAKLTSDATLAQRELPLWDAEREANAPVLTHAQVAQGLKYGRFTLDRALELWQRQGYTADDAMTLAWVESHGDPSPPAPAAAPPAATP